MPNFSYNRIKSYLRISTSFVLASLAKELEYKFNLFIELPSVGNSVKAKDEICVVESVKEASDIYGSKALSKKQYKKNQKKFYSLPEKERNKIWKIKSKRERKGK